MLNLATIAPRLAYFCSGGGQNGRLPRIAAIGAALAAIIVLTAAAWQPPIRADGGASARSKAGASAIDDSDATMQDYAQRILRALADDNTNNWVRYWRARAGCDAAAQDAAAAPLDRVLLTLTAALCARLDDRLGVNLADYSPRGEERTVGLLLNEPGAALGYTLFTPERSKYVYLIGPLGRIAHEWHLGNALPDRTINIVKLLDNGNLLGVLPDRVIEFDPHGNIVWQYNEIDGRLHHDFIKMPNGNVLMLGVRLKTREQAIAAGANPEFVHEKGIRHDYLVEVRPTGANGGEVVWEWSIWDHLVQDFDPSKPNYGVVAEHPELIDINFLLELWGKALLRDWTHTNAIDYNPELDQIMLSPRHFSELWIIDRSATVEEARGHSGGNGGMGGDLLYRWGNPQAYGHGDADDRRLFRQHNTHWIAPGLPGAGNILVFNNGVRGDKRQYSSIDELVPPVNGYRYRRDDNAAYPPDGLAWTYAAEPRADFFAINVSGAQRLPNGNTLIADGPSATIFQATPDGKVVWKYIVPRRYHISLWRDGGAPVRLTHGRPEDEARSVSRNTVYRANWHPPDHPGLQSLDLAPGAYIEDYDLLDWARAALEAGDFGQRLVDSDFDIYLDEDILIYFKQPCEADEAQAKFFLHIIPADARDLPADRQEYGFDARDFRFGNWGKALDGGCIAIAPLPRYPIERIHTGQFTGAGALWRAEVELGE